MTIEPTVVSPSGIAPELLDADAVRTVQRLVGRGYEAYFVGGCVRDILLGRQPKDFDIATAARPQQVKRTFPRNCRIIGRRFKLAHLHFDGGRKILEVSTFRRTPEMNGGDDSDDEDLLITQDNEFGTAEEDALRRDFTVNALFFDPVEDRIIDYVGGLQDVEERVIRTIGDPVIRFREDPVRILRAAKFAGRLGFAVSPPVLEAMAQVAPDLRRSAPPRVLEEILRLLRGGHALDSFQLLRDVGALGVILPLVGRYLEQSDRDERLVFWRLLEALDGRVHSGVVPSTPVLLGTLFTRPVHVAAAARPDESPSTVAEELLGDLTQTLRLPRRDLGALKRICGVQARFAQGNGRRFRPGAFARDPFFSAALELYELTCLATDTPLEQVAVWRQAAEPAPAHEGAGGESPAPAAAATDDPAEEQPRGGSGRRRRRRRRRRRGGGSGEGAPQAAVETAPAPAAQVEPEAVEDGAAPEAPASEPARAREGGRARRKRRRARGQEREAAAAAASEAPAFDRSILAQEIDPKDVPTFGALVEVGKGRKWRRPPR
ncbi:MAG TPA: polynucleotide adenylyltransferase PcnB, partial [Planctomycetota bacterium]|nr:polynucleotide adenylyltransferase PcnB [Planctomycetota bacterium]